MSSNKTEKPTKKRLEDSAKKGQSFKSKDLIIACLTLEELPIWCRMAHLMSLWG
ncbi:virulence associated secretory protein [Salmonella enterica subsp. enterica]|uniref:Virulence associated secretory protein n=1 Tax=Salmonella enterica I TaxID=59201 RepID=A0A379W5E0_SALET|nr:virulence associated secretory protein [Salmonella enterica subsp. enterica]